MPEFVVESDVCEVDRGAFLMVWRVRSFVAAEDLQERAMRAASAFRLDAAANIDRYRRAVQGGGRNPNRYRISSDALARRVEKGEPIPSIAPAVDVNNALSLASGFPIGCYDEHKIEGDVALRLGAEGETMSTLAKGEFDVHRLPILADGAGAFGSPVSDSVRTRIGSNMRSCVFALYGYGEGEQAALRDLIAVVLSVTAIEHDAPVLVRGLRS